MVTGALPEFRAVTVLPLGGRLGAFIDFHGCSPAQLAANFTHFGRRSTNYVLLRSVGL
jgi:hypothetical protein